MASKHTMASGIPGYRFGMSISVKALPALKTATTNSPPFEDIKALLSGRPLKGPRVRLDQRGRS